MVCIRHEDAGYIACRRRGEGNPLLNSCARFLAFWQSDVRCMFKLHSAPSSGAPPILIHQMIESPHKMEVPVVPLAPREFIVWARTIQRNRYKIPSKYLAVSRWTHGNRTLPNDGGERHSTKPFLVSERHILFQAIDSAIFQPPPHQLRPNNSKLSRNISFLNLLSFKLKAMN
jgi:hypothetical protein